MKFRAVHLLTNPSDEREQRSLKDVPELTKFGVEYVAKVNPIWSGEVPEPRFAPDRPFKLLPAHYGCYKSHRDAIFENLTPHVDALLLFECDACFTESPEEFYQRINKAWWACMKGGLDVFTFGPKHNGKIIDVVGDDVIVITQFIETHAYLIPLKSLKLFRETFDKPWDALDYVYTIYLYDQGKYRIGTFKDRATSFQAKGASLITGKVKNTEIHWRHTLYV